MMIKSSEFTEECGFYYGIALAFGLQQFGKNVGCVSLAFIWFCAFLVFFSSPLSSHGDGACA